MTIWDILGVLAAWGVASVVGTMLFALGAALGHRRGVKDTVDEIRRRADEAAQDTIIVDIDDIADVDHALAEQIDRLARVNRQLRYDNERLRRDVELQLHHAIGATDG